VAQQARTAAAIRVRVVLEAQARPLLLLAALVWCTSTAEHPFLTQTALCVPQAAVVVLGVLVVTVRLRLAAMAA
jgi:hypothetical protein